MAEKIGSIYYSLNLDKTQFNQGVRSVKGDLHSMDKGFKNSISSHLGMITSLTAVGASAVVMGKRFLGAFKESESMIAQTNAVLKSTGGVAGVTADEVTKLSKALQRTTAFSDEQVRSTQNMALTFTGIKKDIFPQVTKTALDMATALNHGITPSGEAAADTMKLLGKALQDPDAGLGALKRVGVNVDELKKSFEGVNDIGTKQKLILKELATEFGGSASAAAKTFDGRMKQIKNTINDLEETAGQFIAKTITGFANWAAASSKPGGVLNTLGKTFKSLAKEVRKYWDKWIYPAVHGFGTVFSAIGKVIGSVIGKIVKWWNGLSKSTQDTFKKIALVIGAIVVVINAPIIAIIALISWLVRLYKTNETFKNIVNTIGNIVMTVFRAIASIIKWVWDNVLQPTFEGWKIIITEGIIPAFKIMWGILEPIFNAIGSVFKWVWETILKKAIDELVAIWPTVSDAIGKAWNWIKDNVFDKIEKMVEWLGKAVDATQKLIDKTKEMLGMGDVDTLAILAPGANVAGTGGKKIANASRAGVGKKALGGSVGRMYPYLVGEKGPEIFVPSMPGRIVTARQTADAMKGSSGGQVININVDASGIMATSQAHKREIARSLLEVANQELKAKGLTPIGEDSFRSAS